MSEIFEAAQTELQPHVFWGGLAGAGLGMLILVGWLGGTWLYAAIVVMVVIFFGIVVDVVAHGYKH